MARKWKEAVAGRVSARCGVPLSLASPRLSVGVFVVVQCRHVRPTAAVASVRGRVHVLAARRLGKSSTLQQFTRSVNL